MADLVTRLILKNELFDNNLKKSSKEIQQFKEMGNSVVGMLGKFAGAAGIAVGGMELFDTAMHSCGETQREFENITLGAKESINEFFASLTTGDWSIWEDGILNAIKLGLDYIDTLRRLKQNLNIGDVHLSEVEKTMDDWVKFFENPNISPAEKEKKYVNEYMQWASENLRYPEKLTDITEKNFLRILKDKNVNTKGLSTSYLRDIIFKYNDEAGHDYSALLRYESARKIQKTRQGYYEIDPDKYKNALKESNKEVAKFEKQYKGIETAYDIKVKFEGTEEMDELLDTTDKLIGLEDRGLKVGYDANDINAKFENGKYIDDKNKPTRTTTTKPTTKVNKEEEKEYIKDLSNIKGINAEISRLENERLTASYSRQKQINEEIQDLKQYKKDFEEGNLGTDKILNIANKYGTQAMEVKPEITPGSLADLIKQRDDLVKQLNNAQTPEEYAEIKTRVERKNEEIAIFKGENEIKDNTSLYVDNLNNVATAMNSISQLTNEGAAAWLTWGANIMTAIATAIPAITAIIALKKEEAVANAAAEAAKTPLVGWLTVGAAVAAVAAAMFSIPKFASGGIVPGTSYSGDRVLAGVNSGEMILNNRQQRNLFNLLNNGSSNNLQTNNVTFTLHGSELKGVLDNYNKKMRRI